MIVRYQQAGKDWIALDEHNHVCGIIKQPKPPMQYVPDRFDEVENESDRQILQRVRERRKRKAAT